MVLPQAFDHALLGAVEEELQRVGDIQLLQLREVNIALGVLPAKATKQHHRVSNMSPSPLSKQHTNQTNTAQRSCFIG